MEKTEENNARLPALKPLNQKILFAQKRLATWLNWNCRHLPAKAILTLLIVFTVICSSYFLWLIFSATN
jgi:hypothetical protein